jgi:AraC-like DNA-binding protein
MVVKEELKKLGLHFVVLDLGEVEIMENITQEQRAHLASALAMSGLELMQDKKAILLEKIKNVIIDMVHYMDDLPKTNFSDYLSEKLGQDYNSMSTMFSEIKGITIEHFIILHKIERVKELLMYDELNLTEISYKLNYSSVAHLSNQFKKVTGLTPTNYIKLKQKNRLALEDVGNSSEESSISDAKTLILQKNE